MSPAGASTLGVLRRKLGKALSLSRAEARLLAEAMRALLTARIALARRPASVLIGDLRRSARPAEDGEAAIAASPALAEDLARIERAIATAARHLPWRTDCIVRVIAADGLLRRRGLRPEFYLGATRRPDGSFAAHAWLKCRGIPVAGGEGAEFTVLIGPEGG